MQLLNHKKLHIVAGRATSELVADICRELDVAQGTPNIAEFANGEIHVKYGESIRGSDVFIVQTHTAWDDRSINDSIMEHLIMVDAAKRARQEAKDSMRHGAPSAPQKPAAPARKPHAPSADSDVEELVAAAEPRRAPAVDEASLGRRFHNFHADVSWRITEIDGPQFDVAALLGDRLGSCWCRDDRAPDLYRDVRRK